MAPLTMTVRVFLILGLAITVNADLDDIKSFFEGGLQGFKGFMGAAPEAITDSLGHVIDIEKLPVVPWVPVPELIKNEGYPSENHYITTKDGYILNIHRIPHGKSGYSTGKVVYLQHGLLAASSDYVIFGPKKSLSYVLADAGYDVWMGNFRGNLYSRNHTKLSSNDKAFWEFSWHEMGIIDVPTTIDYILQQTNSSKLYHVGHSQGSTTFYVMTSEKPEYNDKVKVHISLAPVGFMNNLFSPILKLMSVGKIPVETTLNMIGQFEYMPNYGIFNAFTDVFCSQGIGKVLCKNSLFAIAGFSPKQMNVSAIPLLMSHYPAGASTRQFSHYSQEVLSGRFEQFDYGIYNFYHYKSMRPPQYKLEKITCPIHFIYGSNDWIAANYDVERLYKLLPNGKELYNIPNQSWNHLDFQFGNDAPEVVFNKVLDILSKY